MSCQYQNDLGCKCCRDQEVAGIFLSSPLPEVLTAAPVGDVTEGIDPSVINSMVEGCPGMTVDQCLEVIDWLGGQAWKMFAEQSVLAIEVFAGYGRASKIAEDCCCLFFF